MRPHIFLCGGRQDNSLVLFSRRREYLIKVYCILSVYLPSTISSLVPMWWLSKRLPRPPQSSPSHWPLSASENFKAWLEH